MHAPKQRLREDLGTMVLFVHGFMGSPDQFDSLMDAVYQHGCSVASILLPGHGQSGFDFARSTLEMWEVHVKREVARYQHYRRRYIVGHSIGGLLALNESLESRVDGVVALSTPLKIYLLHPIANARKLRLLFLPSSSEVKQCYCRALGIGKPYYLSMPLWPRVLLQPHRLMKKSAKTLQRVTIPTLTIHSPKDETCAFSSAKMLKDALTNSDHESLILQDSFHGWYTPEEQRLINERVLDFISR